MLTLCADDTGCAQARHSIQMTLGADNTTLDADDKTLGADDETL